MVVLGEIINIKGIALRSGISRNNVMYTSEEMKKTASELANKPILMDHDSRSTGVIGKTTFAKFLPDENAIYYEGWIKETGIGIVEAIKDGRLETVSIGAMCEELLEDEDNNQMIARGIHYLELSTTPTPGVLGTSLKQALTNSTKEGKNKAFNEFVNSFNIEESAIDTSKPIFSDSKQGTIPKDNMLRLKCPMMDCDYFSIKVSEFEEHMMNIHQWSDKRVDSYLYIAGIVDAEEEKDEDHNMKSNNLGTDIAPKNEQPVKSLDQKGSNEKVSLSEKEKTEVQSLIFSKDKFNVGSAKKWAKDHNFKFSDVDETEDSIRLRQMDPSQFKRFRTIDLDTGVKAVIGVKDVSGENIVDMEEKKMEAITEKKVDAKAQVEQEKKLAVTQAPEVDHDDMMDDEEDEENSEENPVAYKADDPNQKGYQPGFMPKPGKIHRGVPYDKVSASTKNSESVFLKKLESRDMLIEKLSKDLDEIKGKLSEKAVKSNEKGLVVNERISAGDKVLEISDLDLRFERLSNGKISFWRNPTGRKGQIKVGGQ